MSTVRVRILRDLRDANLGARSPLTSVPFVGPYLERRLRYSLRRPGPLTIGDVWSGTRTRTTDGVLRLLYRALQNERANQCVATRIRRSSSGRKKTYHTGDINQRGYEAIAALLEYNRANAEYGVLPSRFPARSAGSRQCGCRTLRDCNHGPCRLSDDGRACVPVQPTANGFVGVVPHQSQRESADDLHRVRRASSIRVTNALRRDPDSARDLRIRRSRRMVYDRKGSRLWRRPSTRVRYNR